MEEVNMENEENRNDEIIDVRLPRSEYDRLRTVLERERTYDWVTTKLKSNLIWVVASGVLTFIYLYKEFFTIGAK